jgi:large subunit ribosomal protein L23
MGRLRSRKKSWRPKPAKNTHGVKTTLTLEPHQVIVRPVITEKNMVRSQSQNQYTFEVSTLATKEDVRRAVEALWDVKVDKVRTQNRKGKSRRHRFRTGRTSDWKKAIVTLHEEHRIDFF